MTWQLDIASPKSAAAERSGLANPLPAAPPLAQDRVALYGIVASNLLTLVIALWQDWSPLLLIWPYWMQSVAIGWYSMRRILALRNFSTEGFEINGKPADPTVTTRRLTAIFFACHYGFFHLVYLIFIGAFAGVAAASSAGSGFSFGGQALGAFDFWMSTVLGIVFFFTHRTSFRRNLAADQRGAANIGTLMFLPYLRILPMHLTIILGAALGSGALTVLLFGTLKTAADATMHIVEHRLLRGPA